MAQLPNAAVPRSWFDLLIDAMAVVSAGLVVLLTALVLVDVGLRATRLFTLPWSLEAAEYGLYVITFLGAPWVLREEGHIAIELVVERLAPRPRALLRRLTDLIGGAVCALLFYYFCRVLWRSYESKVLVQKSFTFPEWLIFALGPPVMLVLFGIYLRWILRSHAKQRAARLSDGV